MQLEILVEEPSMEAALEHLVPRILENGPDPIDWYVRRFNGKPDLMRRLPDRMRGYASYADAVDLRILVLIDRDADDCRTLKAQMEDIAIAAGLRVRAGGGFFRVCNRIAIEELEAWFIGDPEALVTAYPRVPSTFCNRAKFRSPDGVTGGTWEALERLLKGHEYHREGLPKVGLADAVARHMDPARNGSPSFQAFRSGLRSLVMQ